MDNKKCVVCYSNNYVKNVDTDVCILLKSQLSVIFLVRQLLEIPQNICVKFLQVHGDPFSWITCCDSCLVFVNKGIDIHKKIDQLRKEFDNLRTEIKTKIIVSKNSHSPNSVILGCDPTEIIRNRISQNENIDAVGSESIEVIDLQESSDESGSIADISNNEFHDESDGGGSVESVVVADNLTSKEKAIKNPAVDISSEKLKSPSKSVSADAKKTVTNSTEKPTCKLCGRKLASAWSLKMHMRIHDEKNCTCEYCGKILLTTYKLITHLKSHTKEPLHSCDICHKTFLTKDNLDHHKTSHLEKVKETFVSTECSETSLTKRNLTEPVQELIGENAVKCDTCGRRYSSLHFLTEHQKIHSKQSFICETCGKEFSCSNSLRKHTKWHMENKPCKCSFCEKTFVDQYHLKEHERVHTGEKPYLCTECGKTFAVASNLKSHAQVHRGDKPFGCDTCGRTFAKVATLRNHQRTHTGERSYLCTVCGKGFTLRQTLRKHYKVHTGEKPFSCPVCGRRFAERSHLKYHSRTHKRDCDNNTANQDSRTVHHASTSKQSAKLDTSIEDMFTAGMIYQNNQ